MKEFFVEKSTEVKASPQAIWDAMMDVAEWPKWKPFVSKARIASDYHSLSIGSRIKMSLMAGGPAAMPLTAVVSDFVRPSRLAWTGGAHGIFYAEHSFSFDDLGNGSTRVTSRERFTGSLLSLIMRVVTPDDMDTLHTQWVQAIKEKMEGRQEPAPAAHSH